MPTLSYLSAVIAIASIAAAAVAVFLLKPKRPRERRASCNRRQDFVDCWAPTVAMTADDRCESAARVIRRRNTSHIGA